MAIFYEGPYIKADGLPSKQIVIGRVGTMSRTITTKIAKLLSRDGQRKKKVVTGSIPERGFTVRTQSGRVVKTPKIIKRAEAFHRKLVAKARKTSRAPKTSRVAKFFR